MGNRRITLYIAESLNGYIATPEHSLDWLLSTEGEGDNGFKAYYDSIDTILLGQGIPLLAKENIDTCLRLTDMKRYGQFVELHYDVKYR